MASTSAIKDVTLISQHTIYFCTHIHPKVIDEALLKEVAENRMAGLYDSPPYCNLRCSGVGVVPKKGVEAGGSLTTSLLLLTTSSMPLLTPGIFLAVRLDDAIIICHTLGQGALMTKVDMKNAFGLCPVRQEDWHLLGITLAWQVFC